MIDVRGVKVASTFRPAGTTCIVTTGGGLGAAAAGGPADAGVVTGATVLRLGIGVDATHATAHEPAKDTNHFGACIAGNVPSLGCALRLTTTDHQRNQAFDRSDGATTQRGRQLPVKENAAR